MIDVVPLTATDVVATAEVLAEAFDGDPVFEVLLPRAEGRRARLHRFYTAELHMVSRGPGAVDLARGDGGQMLGVAVWLPHPDRGSTWRAMRQAPRFAAVLGVGGLVRGVRLGRGFTAHRPAAPHWYLSDIAVAASGRGAGVGSALLRHRLDVLDRDGALAYLEATTPSSRRLYERHGFDVVGEIAGFGDPPPVAMTRQPR